MTRSVLAAALCVLAALSCGDSGTGPSEPAEPTGKLLVFDQISTIYVVDLATGDSREVSVDGEPFFWVSATFDAGANVVIGGSTGVGQPSRGIRQLDLASGAITTLVEGVNGFAASLAPDGKTLAYAAGDETALRPAVFTMELGSGEEPERRWVAPDGAPQQSIANLRWLPDQSGLIGNLYDLPSVHMVRIDPGMGAITPITEPGPIGMTRTLDVSPDGNTIVFNTDTGELRFITLSGEAAPGYPTDLRGLFPAFSPDGKLLAWSRLKEGILELDGIWFYRFSDGAMWRALPAESELTWLLDWG
jgi:WD40 repeat protein